MATEASEDKVNLVTKEIELTKLLASNDPKIRSDGIKQIKQLLLSNSGDTDEGMFHYIYILIYIRVFPLNNILRNDFKL